MPRWRARDLNPRLPPWGNSFREFENRSSSLPSTATRWRTSRDISTNARPCCMAGCRAPSEPPRSRPSYPGRSEEHTSELQSRLHLVCRLLLEKKKNDLHEASLEQSREEGHDLHQRRRAPPHDRPYDTERRYHPLHRLTAEACELQTI